MLKTFNIEHRGVKIPKEYIDKFNEVLREPHLNELSVECGISVPTIRDHRRGNRTVEVKYMHLINMMIKKVNELSK